MASASTKAFAYPTGEPVKVTAETTGWSQVAPQWRDLWAAVLYMMSTAAFLTLAGFSIHHLAEKTSVVLDASEKHMLWAILGSQLAAMTVALGLSAVHLVLMYKFPEGMITGSYILSTAMTLLTGLLFLFGGGVLGGILMIVLSGLNLFMLYCWRKLIPFSGLLLKYATSVFTDYPALYAVNFGIVGVLLAVLVLFATHSVGTLFMVRSGAVTESYFTGTLIYSVFWLLWTEEITQNVSRVTSAGVIGTRYFLGRNSPQAPNPTSASLKRAMTYSFGSICFGSLLVAIISFLRLMLESSEDRNSIGGALADCFLRILEDLMRYFNTYAFTQVALYGKNYTKAASDTWSLIHRSGLGAVINDNLTGSVLALGSFFIGLVGGFTAAIIFSLIRGPVKGDYVVYAGLAGIFSASLIAWCGLAIVRSGITTFYVCLAEDPNALRRTDPEMHSQIASKYSFLNL